MSEVADPGSIDEEMKALNTTERLIEIITGIVVSTRVLKAGPIRPDMAHDGVRWAALWYRDFVTLMNMHPEADTATLMLAARYSSVERFDSGVRYSSGAPAIQTTVAAYDAFCLSFGEQMPWASEILGWDMGVYDPAAEHESKPKDPIQDIAAGMVA